MKMTPIEARRYVLDYMARMCTVCQDDDAFVDGAGYENQDLINKAANQLSAVLLKTSLREQK